MEDSTKNQSLEIDSLPIPLSSGEAKENVFNVTSRSSKPNKEEIINQAFNFHLQGKIVEASKYYQYCLNQNFNDHRVFSNYALILKDCGKLQEAELSLRKAIELKPDFAEAHANLGGILHDLGKLQEAELSTRKAIEFKPNYVEAYSNLGTILNNLGKLKEAELSLRKAIELDSDCAKAYYSISTLKCYKNNKSWKNNLFSESIINNKTEADKINLYFARANVYHKEKNYKESAKNLTLANNLQLNIKLSKPDILFKKSELLLIESDKIEINLNNNINCPKSIFIVGMPRSGSTLIESILSMNPNVIALGESNILEESIQRNRKAIQESTLAEEYWKQVNHDTKLKIITNKWLYNYQYAGIIAKSIPQAKIIHCFRNPLDNILSIYRTHFAKGNEYSSSLDDCTRVYLNQEKIMTEYKNRFRSKIYDLNYDLLVSKPSQEIKSLISWLNCEWNDSYLKPHLNPRAVSTASSVQVRSPINQKSLGGWKNYKEMLSPVIDILIRTTKYRDILN